jgi:hypothetical protein
MKNCLLLLLSIFVFQVSLSQDVKITKHSDKKFPKTKNKAEFHYLEPSLDTTNLTHIATLEVSALKNPSLYGMYKKMRDEAKRMGANAFRVQKYSQATILLIVDVYRVSENIIDQNILKKVNNTIYVFAGDPFDKSTYYNFEMNGIGKSVRNGTYFKYGLHQGEQVKLKKGTVTGTIMWVKWKPNQLAHYYSIYGLSDKAVVKRTAQSESFKEGKFITVERGLGDLLVSVLEEKN